MNRTPEGENANRQDAARGLLLLTLRDLAEGDIPLGWGKRKGYGACQASSPDQQDLIAAATAWLGQSDPGAAETSGAAAWLQSLRALRPEGAPTASLPPDLAQQLAAASKGHAAQGIQGTQDSSASRATTTHATPAADRFHNSYHFVPLETPADLPAWVKRQAFQDNKKSLGHHSHSRYASQTSEPEGTTAAAPVFSGRITCVLTAETPFIVGGSEQTGQRTKNPDGSTIVHPYQLPDGQLAIPASSLKGLISSVAEAASGSAMRVFDDQRQLSYRKAMRDSLSAVGMVVDKVINGRELRCVQALGFPFVSVPEARSLQISKDHWFDGAELAGLNDPFNFSEPRVYIGSYLTRTNPSGEVISVKDLSGFLNTSTNTYTVAHPNYHYIREDKLQLHWKEVGNSMLLVSQTLLPGYQRPLTEKEFLTNVSTGNKLNYIRGILRVLGRFGNERKNIPRNKTHELFLIYPKESEDVQDATLNPSVYPITKSTRCRFLDLAKEANERESCLPYAPQGTRPAGQGVTDLRVGDLVFFKLNEKKHISELSFSMIWRDRVENEDKTRPLTLKDFLPRDPASSSGELLPFHQNRKMVSPAELLFGFVELNEKGSPEARQANQDTDQALAFAGKLHIQDALHQNISQSSFQLPPPVTLKILAQPKLNDVLYFKKLNGTPFFRKKDMKENGFVLRGRKQYLHAYSQPNDDGTRDVKPFNIQGDSDTNGKAPWETHHPQDDLAQKSRVRLVPAGERFEFRLGLADAPGSDELPYARRALADFDERFCYDRFWHEAADSSDSPSRIMNCGYAFTMVGSFADKVFFMNPRDGAWVTFRQIYARMGLVAHFQKAALLGALARLSALAWRLPDGSMSYDRPETHERLKRFYAEFLEFTQVYWFDEVSPQAQGVALFEMWQRELRSKALYEEVRQELKDLVEYMNAEAAQRQADATERFTRVAAWLGGLGVAAGLLGMNWLPLDNVVWSASAPWSKVNLILVPAALGLTLFLGWAMWVRLPTRLARWCAECLAKLKTPKTPTP